jgi:hypothetical protein
VIAKAPTKNVEVERAATGGPSMAGTDIRSGAGFPPAHGTAKDRARVAQRTSRVPIELGGLGEIPSPGRMAPAGG